MLAMQIFHTNRTVLAVEQHSGGQGIELDVEFVALFASHLQYTLTTTNAGAIAGGNGQVAHAESVCLHQSPVVRVASRLEEPQEPLEEILSLGKGRPGRTPDAPHQHVLSERYHWIRPLGAEPAAEAVAGAVQAKTLVQPSIEWPVVAIFQALEILTHVLRLPGSVAGQLEQIVPVGVMRVDHDHGIMSRTAAERARPGIKDPIALTGEV